MFSPPTRPLAAGGSQSAGLKRRVNPEGAGSRQRGGEESGKALRHDAGPCTRSCITEKVVLTELFMSVRYNEAH